MSNWIPFVPDPPVTDEGSPSAQDLQDLSLKFPFDKTLKDGNEKTLRGTEKTLRGNRGDHTQGAFAPAIELEADVARAVARTLRRSPLIPQSSPPNPKAVQGVEGKEEREVTTDLAGGYSSSHSVAPEHRIDKVRDPPNPYEPT